MNFYENSFKGKLKYLSENSKLETDRIIYNTLMSTDLVQKYAPKFIEIEYTEGMGRQVYRRIYKRISHLFNDDRVKRDELLRSLKEIIDNYSFTTLPMDHLIYNNLIGSDFMKFAPVKYNNAEYEEGIGKQIHRAIYKRIANLFNDDRVKRDALWADLNNTVNGKSARS